MLTGHHHERSWDDRPATLDAPQQKHAAWIAAAGTVAWMVLVGRGWLNAYFTLDINDPGPTTEQVASFNRTALLATVIFAVSMLAAIAQGRHAGASWWRSAGLALAGIAGGIAVPAVLLVFVLK